jgi:hypothetical protein
MRRLFAGRYMFLRKRVSTCMGDPWQLDGNGWLRRARRRRGLRKVSVEVHEDELRAIALKGYEGGATSSDTGVSGPTQSIERDATAASAEYLAELRRHIEGFVRPKCLVKVRHSWPLRAAGELIMNN